MAYWINSHLDLEGEQRVDKRHPAVDRIHTRILEAYEAGRSTSFSTVEMKSLTKRYLPELFASEFDHLKKFAHSLASQIMHKLAEEPCIRAMNWDEATPCLERFLDEYPFIQWLYLTDTKGKLITSFVTHPTDRPKYASMPEGTDLSDRDWFQAPMRDGRLHITDFYRSAFTGRLCLTVSVPVADAKDDITGVLGADIRFEELLKRQGDLDNETGLEDVD